MTERNKKKQRKHLQRKNNHRKKIKMEQETKRKSYQKKQGIASKERVSERKNNPAK